MADEYVGAEAVLVYQWIKERLEAVADDLDDIEDGLSARVHEDVAPDDESYPYIVIQCQDEPRDIRGVGTFRVMVDTLYVVKAVSQVDSYAPLAPIAKVIDSAMTSAEGGPVTTGDGLVLSSVRQSQFALRTVEQGTQFRHLGGAYQMYAQSAS